MNLPRGNVLLKPTELELEDVQTKLNNLRQSAFSGYIQIDVPGVTYHVFLKEGILKSIIQVAGKHSTLASELLLVHRLRHHLCRVSSFVLSPDLVDVLSNWYAFAEKVLNYQVLKKEFRKVLGSLDSEKITGMIEIQIPEENSVAYFLLSQGRIVTDQFLDLYGQIVTGPETVSELVKKLSAEGGLVSCFGEKADVIDRKTRRLEEDLGRYKELLVTVETGLLPFAQGSAVRVDESVIREWSKVGPVNNVEILTAEGYMAGFKAAGKKGLGDRISLSGAVGKKLRLKPGESVVVRPGGSA